MEMNDIFCKNGKLAVKYRNTVMRVVREIRCNPGAKVITLAGLKRYSRYYGYNYADWRNAIELFDACNLEYEKVNLAKGGTLKDALVLKIDYRKSFFRLLKEGKIYW